MTRNFLERKILNSEKEKNKNVLSKSYKSDELKSSKTQSVE